MMTDHAPYYPSPNRPGFFQLEELTPEEITWNVNRLEAEAKARADHAHALLAWDADRSHPPA